MYKDIIAYSNILFQYGHTLITTCWNRYNWHNDIYIPIWFYFNQNNINEIREVL